MSPRGRGKGRNGGGGSRLRPDAVPLSSLLYEERPLLRPVVFVRSVMTSTLFQEEDEIFKPVTEEVGEECCFIFPSSCLRRPAGEGDETHVPTAERVFRVFSGNVPRVPTPRLEEDSDLEEVDFNDLGKLLDVPDYEGTTDIDVVEERFTGFYIDATTSSQGASPSSYHGALISDDPTPAAAMLSLWDGETDDANLTSERLDSQVTTVPAPGVDPGQHYSPNVQPTLSSNGNNPVAAALPDHGHLSPPSPSPPTHRSEVDGKDLGPSSSFYIDIEPSPVPFDVVAPSTPSHTTTTITSGRSSAEEEVIVYVAPHPRSQMEPGRGIPGSGSVPGTFQTDHGALTTTALSMTSVLTGVASTRPSVLPSPPPFSSVSFTTLRTGTPSPGKPRQVNHPLVDVVLGNVNSKVRVRKRVHEARTKKKRRERVEKMEGLFGGGGAFGASALQVAEARLRGDEVVGFGGNDDPRWEERRRGDSDVDWGSDAEGDEEKEGEGVAEGMEVGPELVDEINGDAMRQFVEGMCGRDAGKWESMGDLEDKERMRVEDGDNEGEQRGSSGEDTEGDDDNEDDDDEDDEEIERVIDREEKVLIAEGVESDRLGEDDKGEDEDDSDDPEHSPGTSFKARLAKLRAKTTRFQEKEREATLTDDEDDVFMENQAWTKHDKDEAYIAHIQVSFRPVHVPDFPFTFYLGYT